MTSIGKDRPKVKKDEIREGEMAIGKAKSVSSRTIVHQILDVKTGCRNYTQNSCCLAG